MSEPSDRAFPVLADHVRLQPLCDYVKVVHVRSGQILHLSRREALCLEMARGDSSLADLVQVVRGVFDLDGPTARQGVLAALELFPEDVEWRDAPTRPRTVSDPMRLFGADSRLRPLTPYRQERPTRLTLSVTAACNYRCAHCCNGSGERLPGELRGDQWCEVIRSAGDIGVVTATFSGGEPLTRPDLPDLIAEASMRGVYPVLSTNASLIDRTVAGRLERSGLRFAHVSLFAATAELHERLAGRRNWFSRARDGISHLLAQGVYVRLKTVLVPGNVDAVPQVLDLAGSLGVQEVHLAPYRLTHLAPGGSSLLLTPEALARVAVSVRRWRERTGSTLVVRAPDPQEEHLAWSCADDIVRCGGIKQELTVLPDGGITLCEVLKDRPEFLLGQVLRDGLMGVWQSSRPELIMERLRGEARGACRGCPHLDVCRTGCFALSMACGGSATSPDPRCWRAEYVDNPFRTPQPVAVADPGD